MDEGIRADRALLARRLAGLGLAGVRAVVVHANRSVMVRHTRDGVLHIHRGYVYAPDAVLAAVVRFLRPRLPRSARRLAVRTLLAFPVHDYVAPAPRRRRPSSATPEDRPILERLRAMHRRLNAAHFGEALRSIPFRLSSRMRTRLGELRLDPATNAPEEIAISRRHLTHDGWEQVELTVLHEMVHQWQAACGLRVDHGPHFRAKARAVGIAPRARAELEPTRRRTTPDDRTMEA